MSQPIEFDSEARFEFDSALQWYSERSHGAAFGFLCEVEEAIAKIVIVAIAHAKRRPAYWRNRRSS